MKKFFGFGSSTPPPPPVPSKPPDPPAKPAPAAAPARAKAATPSPADEAFTTEPPSIVGRWQEPGTSDTTEFHADGSVTEKTGTGETIRGRYWLRDKHLKLNLEGVADELSFPVAIGSRTLEMTDSEDKVTLYQRIS